MRQRAQVAQRGELHLHVVGGAAHQQAQEREPAFLVEPAGDAVVEQRDPAVGHDEEVAAVQVAVEHAVEDGALEERHHAGAHDGRGVDAGRLHARDVVEAEAVEALHHQDTPGDEGGVGAGDHDGALVALGEDARDVEHVLGFEAEVELLDDGLREQLDQRGRVGQRGDRDAADQHGCDPTHGGEVAAHEVGNLRALHLDDDVLAGLQRGRVYLRDRRGGDRRAVEAREHLLERLAEVTLDDGTHGFERLGGDLVAQHSELVDELLGEDALTRRQDLAQLDVGGAVLLELLAQPPRQPGARLGLVSRAALADVPAGEGLAEAPADRDHAAAGGQQPAAGELGHFGRGGLADPVQAAAPDLRVGLHRPGPVVAEGAESEVVHPNRVVGSGRNLKLTAHARSQRPSGVLRPGGDRLVGGHNAGNFSHVVVAATTAVGDSSDRTTLISSSTCRPQLSLVQRSCHDNDRQGGGRQSGRQLRWAARPAR